MMTIEYLRARLLSERSISKATKERADELAIRVSFSHIWIWAMLFFCGKFITFRFANLYIGH